MPTPDPNKRDYLLPAGCKDLGEALQKEMEEKKTPIPLGPVTHTVELPAQVSVRYLAELTGWEMPTFMSLLSAMNIVIDSTRSVDFAVAQRILRRCGIGAVLEDTDL